jgi:hypothetical protein
MATLTFKERAARIAEAAKRLSDELEQANFPEPSFELGLPKPLFSDAPDTPALRSKQELLHMVDELHSLLTEPVLQLTAQLVSTPIRDTTLFFQKCMLKQFPQSAQSYPQCAPHHSPRDCREFSTRGNHCSGSG